jgi:hypothetical protein
VLVADQEGTLSLVERHWHAWVGLQQARQSTHMIEVVV